MLKLPLVLVLDETPHGGGGGGGHSCKLLVPLLFFSPNFVMLLK